MDHQEMTDLDYESIQRIVEEVSQYINKNF